MDYTGSSAVEKEDVSALGCILPPKARLNVKTKSCSGRQVFAPPLQRVRSLQDILEENALVSEDHLVGCLEDVFSLGGEGWELSDGTTSVGGKHQRKVQGSER